MENAVARIKTIKWGGLWLLVLTGLSIKLYLTFIQLSANFSRIEKYTFAHRILHSTTLNVSTDESVAESLTTWITKFTPFGFPADGVTILEIIDSVPNKKDFILLYDFDLAGRCTFSFLEFESGDSSSPFVNEMEFLNDVREIE